MLAVFIKEMRQFRRGYARWIVLAMMGASLMAVIFAWKFHIGIDILIYPALFLSLLIISGESSSTWRRELGDPAFSPGVTTPLPPLAIALGKAGALFCQLVATALIFSVIFAGSYLVKFKSIEKFGVSHFAADLGLSGTFMGNLCKVYDEYGIAFLAFALMMTSLPLAICSLKPRRKAGGVDFGSWCAVGVMALICLSEYNGMLLLNWKWRFLLNAVLFSIGALMLIAARVAPPASDRLLPFKTFVLLQALVIKPLLSRYWPEIFIPLTYRDILLNMSGNFAVIALFERLEQSRRVLNIRRPAWVSGLLFPVTTGALNSLSTAAVSFIIAMGMKKFAVVDSGVLIALSMIFASLAALNLSRLVRVWPLIWFIIILGMLLAIAFAVMVVMIKGYGNFEEEMVKFQQQGKIYCRIYFALLSCAAAAGFWMLIRIYRKKVKFQA